MKRSQLLIALLILLLAVCVACSDKDEPIADSGSAPESAGASASVEPALTSQSPVSTVEVIATTLTSGTATAEPVWSDSTAAAPVTTSAPTTAAPITATPTTVLPITSAPISSAPSSTAPVTTKPITTRPITTTEAVTERPSTLVTPDVEPHKNDYVKVIDYIPSLYVDLRYAGKDNLAGIPLYRYSDAYLRYGTVKRLAAVQEDLLKEGYSLLIWDAYRPLSAQLTLSEVLPYKCTSPVVKTIPYNHGDTLSVSIVKADGSSIAIPYDFDADRKASSSKAKANAERLSDAMEAHGFTAYLNDWYRFTDKDDYPLDATLTIGEKGVERCPEWVTICDESLSLRIQPDYDAEVITKLPRGMKLRIIFIEADFAYVEADGQYGYVLAAYVARTTDGLYQSELEVIEPSETYNYAQMQSDLEQLADAFPDRLRLSSIGKSEEGRDLTLAVLGNEAAEKTVFLQSTIHAREYMVTELTMAQIDYMLYHQDIYLDCIEMTIGELLDRVCFHIVPMSNPDGVEIVHTGKIPDAMAGSISADKAAIWKANAKGVDLNANFDADWEDYGSGKIGEPNYMGYKGTSPECAAESKALADYLRDNSFNLILSYHASGSVIYYYYGGSECAAVNAQNYDLSRRLSVISGFTINGQPGTSTAGLKDWAIQSLKTPSLTIEFASWTSPVMLREFDQMWVRCRDMLSVCGKWVLDQS